MKPRVFSSLQCIAVSLLLAYVQACGGGGGGPEPQTESAARFTTFESGQVRPITLSVDGSTLYVLNTPDGRLEIYDSSGDVPMLEASVPVGMEPVALALRNDAEIWVVNHLSDSISIVDVAQTPPRVTRTLLVGDEPRDIVFAGPGFDRAFITAAHRGQHAPFDPQFKTPGVSRADVWVFDANDLGDMQGGTPLTIVSMFGDTTRALATNADGSKVYVAVFNSGNQTATLLANVPSGGLDKPPPQANGNGETAPRTGMIVKFNGTDWLDNGDPVSGVVPRSWNDSVRFSLPDNDVFEIDALATPPVQSAVHNGVGTTLFNLAVNPATGKVYVSNTEARNHVRFEGAGSRNTTVRGHIAESRITVINGSEVLPRHLNKHISSYEQDLGTEAERKLSLAQPLQMQVTSNGEQLYVVGFGSAKVAVYATDALEDDSFNPVLSDQMALSAGGPSGLALDESRQRLYVLTRFDNGISVVNTQSRQEIAHVRMHNPEPAHVVEGRPFLYDATLTSSRGDSSCASCHIFGDIDHLAWDLGDPDDEVKPNPRAYAVTTIGAIRFFHPMKGPMTTQSLRGMRGNGPMHWRGDRTGQTADSDETLEEQAFEDFNVAFVSLLGRDNELTAAQMDAFAKFALEISYPPNPIRNLDNSLTAGQADGRNTYLNVGSTGGGVLLCRQCHVLDVKNNQFGTGGLMSVEGSDIAEDFKVPHLRNAYQKIGMFGSTGDPGDGQPDTGPQVRGFGFQHDGSIDTLTTFLSSGSATSGAGFVFASDQARENVIDFVFAMDSELAPTVGQQVTLSPANAGDTAVDNRLQLLVSRALLVEPRPECELVAKGVVAGEARGAYMNEDQLFVSDRADDELRTTAELATLARQPGNSITFTCVPPGEGERVGVDRDADGVFDRDELDANFDPADSDSSPLL